MNFRVYADYLVDATMTNDYVQWELVGFLNLDTNGRFLDETRQLRTGSTRRVNFTHSRRLLSAVIKKVTCFFCEITREIDLAIRTLDWESIRVSIAIEKLD